MNSSRALFEEVLGAIDRHLYLEPHYPVPLALWAFHTHLYRTFEWTPYLWIHSPLPGCGKTTLGELLFRLSARAIFASSVSKAALYRYIQDASPTFIIDEAEGQLEKTDMKSIINAGYKRTGGEVVRIYRGNPTRFAVYCPKVIICLKDLPPTIVDRAIRVELTRLPEGRRVEPLALMDPELGSRLKRWVAAHEDEISEHAMFSNVTFLQSREATLWAPLFTLAHFLCPERVPDLKETAKAMTEEKRDEQIDNTPLLALLRDLNEVALPPGEHVRSEDLVRLVQQLPESRWEGLEPRALAKLLRPLRLRPKAFWKDGSTCRGYDRTLLLKSVNAYK